MCTLLFSEGGVSNFHIKNKLKSVIFNDKKLITNNSNWEILTDNLVTFRRKDGVYEKL